MSIVTAFVAGLVLATTLSPHEAQINARLRANPGATEVDGFHRELQAVMIQMDAAMCITPSASADRDFARAMIPHHQGAIEMARLELKYGRDPRLRRLAQGMVIEQSQEIALLRNVLADDSAISGIDRNP